MSVTHHTNDNPEGVVSTKEDGASARENRNFVGVFAEEDSIQISLEGDLRLLGHPGDVELVRAAVAEVFDQALAGDVSLVVPDGDQGGQPLQISFC